MLARVLLSLSVLSFVGATAAADSLAVFTDTIENTGNTVQAGSVSISSGPGAAFLTVANMAPGDTTIAGLTVTNDGTLELRYALTSASTNDDGLGLAAALTLDIREDSGAGCGAQDGNLLYSGSLAAAALGSVAQGHQAGDRVLGASSAEVLCFRVHLPLGAANTLQGAATTTTFTLSAEQTANNP